jgi:hypothetical protein
MSVRNNLVKMLAAAVMARAECVHVNDLADAVVEMSRPG